MVSNESVKRDNSAKTKAIIKIREIKKSTPVKWSTVTKGDPITDIRKEIERLREIAHKFPQQIN